MMKLDLDCVEHPELLELPINACRSAGLFWQENDINKWADAGDIDGVSDKVNKGRKTKAYGDTNGWEDRLAIYNRAMKIL
jgi:putative chitinase